MKGSTLGVHIVYVLMALLFASAIGCIPPTVTAHSKFAQPAQPLEGKRVVIAFVYHERLKGVSELMEKIVTKDFQERGIEVIPFKSAGITLEDNEAFGFARQQHAPFLLVYALTGGGTYNMALSHVSSEGALFDAPAEKMIWHGSIDYSDPMPGPGGFSKCGRAVAAKLIGTLVTDGYLANR
jgi:hypothetical protein